MTFLNSTPDASGRRQRDEVEREIPGLIDQTGLDGLIVTARLSESRTLIRGLDRRSVPFVRIAPNDVRHSAPYADMDDKGAAREMTEHLGEPALRLWTNQSGLA